MELTKQELKIAKIAAKKYDRLIYRKNQLIGLIGGVLGSLGLLDIFGCPEWCRELLVWAGLALIMWSIMLLFMSIIGKLYQRNRRLEIEHRKPEA